MKKLGLIFVLFIAVWGCSEDKLDTYSGTSCIYFAPYLDGSWKDTTQFSFTNFFVTDTVIRIKVQALGKVSDQPRSFKVMMENTTATPGVHFDALQSEYVLKAGATSAVIPIKLYRHADLLDTVLSISLYLAPSENFDQVMPRKIDSYTKKEVDVRRQVLTFSDMIIKPVYWDMFDMFYGLGYWSTTKFVFMNKLCEIDPLFWYGMPNLGKVSATANYMKNYLNEMALQGWEYAIKDPKGPKGYMTVNGVNIPASFPDLSGN